MIRTHFLRQLGAWISIVLSSTLLAGLYGILHDQFTYSISPEYYTKFKFVQFGIRDTWGEAAMQDPRMAVSAVGFMATWWTGLIIGPILGSLGLLLPDSRLLFRSVFKAIGITLITAICCGLFGLALGAFALADKIDVGVPIDVVERSNFITVGIMHNFSYFGAGLGLIIGIRYLNRKRKQQHA